MGKLLLVIITSVAWFISGWLLGMAYVFENCDAYGAAERVGVVYECKVKGDK